MLLLQVGFFSIALLNEAHPILAMKGVLSIGINGYNRLFDFVSQDKLDMNSVPLSKMLKQMSMTPRLIGNFNIMLFIEVFLMVLTVSVGLIVAALKKYALRL